MRRALALSLAAVALLPWSASALDPPHNATRSIDCSSCHTPHTAPGGTITSVAGNGNLCLSCHLLGGAANNKPFVASDQALPGPGLPSGTSASGTSHRWDSGASGHVAADVTNTSPGEVRSGGAFTGRYAKTYTITITTAGNLGAARFNWTATTPGGGSGTSVPTGTNVALNEGITLTFVNGTGTSFVLNDRWYLYVRTDITQPATAAMAVRLENGKIMCSTCHDQHSQANEPFDPSAPAYAGAGTGAGRHFQRAPNDTNQMCTDCHGARNVTASASGSHPVGVAVTPTPNKYQNPLVLPLDKTAGEVRCTTCHSPHYTATSDGTLLRLSNVTGLCTDCHALADIAVPAKHFVATDARTLWPGAQYGTTFPQVTDPARQGACTNCHQPHGWPDTANTALDYPTLLVDREENLCYTCHDGSPVAKNIRGEFLKTYRHPAPDYSGRHTLAEGGVPASYGTANRHAECADCHNPHQAQGDTVAPAAPAVSNRLRGVGGVAVSNGAAGAVPGYVWVDAAASQYEICFKCHSSWTTLPSGVRDKAIEFNPNNESFHPVEAAGRNASATMTNNLAGGTGLPHLTTASVIWCTDCHNSDAIPTTVSTLSGYSGPVPKGPHGSGISQTLRANYRRTQIPKDDNYSRANFTLCFVCHSPAPYEDDSGDPRSDTNFRYHGFHVTKLRGNPGGSGVPGNLDTPGNGTAGQGNAVCKECHYQQHSNKLTFHASNQSYSRLVNFAPSLAGQGGTGSPSWSQAGRSCSLRCHGESHDPYTY